MPDDSLLDLAEYIEEKLDKQVLSHEFVHDELVIDTKPEHIIPVLQFLRDSGECLFSVLCDICAVDYLGRPQRFDVVYSLLSMRQNNRARVKVAVEEGEMVPSVTSLFSSAMWYEREVWDMYGIAFSDNADLRRILSDYGFEGHAQRKDFPLSGYVELRYDEEQKRLVYEPVQFMQAYRNFDSLSPWEGVSSVQYPENKGSTSGLHGFRSADKKKKEVENASGR